MDNVKICQSCAMPLTEEKLYGTNKDGSRNEDYCCYCYMDGGFIKEETMEEAIESCIPFVSENNPYSGPDEARKAMLEFYPTLKRWKK